MLLDREPPRALTRNRVTSKLRTGIKTIDAFMPICYGQRPGIFAGSGVGKSTLLAMLSAVPDVSVVVLALVGERGREVREFLEDVLGSQRERVISVVATGDASPAVRRLAPKTAMTIAEYFRSQGHNVLLMIDSITRFAHAQREYALTSGEPPVARGYPPSVFAEIARLLERSGPGPPAKATSRFSRQFSSMVTTTTIPFQMLCAASSTVTSCWIAKSRRWGGGRRSISCHRCRDLQIRSGALKKRRSFGPLAPWSQDTRIHAIFGYRRLPAWHRPRAG